MTLVAKAGRGADAGVRPARGIFAPKPWRPAADRVHGIVAVAALSGTAVLCLASPLAGEALRTSGGPLLLVAGALIGVPHGASDFVVARRLMHRAWGRSWLPVFLVVYLTLVAATLVAWSVLPLATLVGFLVISGFHFGSSDMRAAAPSVHPRLDFALRATTPILPIFLIHRDGVAGFVAALGGSSEPATLHLLETLRWPLLLPWGTALTAVTLPGLLAGGRRWMESMETLATALAAAVLPPLVAFGLYFCLVHAVRHMLEIAADHHPTRPRAAATLAACIVMPSALVCLAALCLAWNRLAGPLNTGALITWSLRGIAALTVPHIALELWAAARPRDDAASAGEAMRPFQPAVRCDAVEQKERMMATLVWDAPAVVRWSPEMSSEQVGGAGKDAETRSFPNLRAALNFVIEELEASPRMNVGVYPERGSALIDLPMIEQAYRSHPLPEGEPGGPV